MLSTDAAAAAVVAVHLAPADVVEDARVREQLSEERMAKGFFERRAIRDVVFQHLTDQIKE